MRVPGLKPLWVRQQARAVGAAMADLAKIAAAKAVAVGAGALVFTAWPGTAWAQTPEPTLRSTPSLAQEWPPDVPSQALPVFIDADEITGRTEQDAQARGSVVLRRGTTNLRSDRLDYDISSDTVRATGDVRVYLAGDLFEGPELQLQLDTFEGFFLTPTYRLLLTGGGGTAERMDFIDRHRSVATRGTYTTCTPDDEGAYAWLLSADSVRFDTEANEGVARNVVLRFMGVPVLATPWMSFPLSDERKSGLLPPSIGLDNRSGFQYEQPYYWNIAPDHDATITPTLYTRRGADLAVEYRYLRPDYAGALDVSGMPSDRLRERDRWSYALLHNQRLSPMAGGPAQLQFNLNRVSDDDYWKDFRRHTDRYASPRLLPSTGRLDWQPGNWRVFLLSQSWQTLQDPESPIRPPYDQVPQVRADYSRFNQSGVDWSLTMDTTRFRNPFAERAEFSDLRNGTRSYALADASYPLSAPWGFLTPRVQLHGTYYNMEQPLDDGRLTASRAVPTYSLDSGLIFERETSWFGRATLQTLEPRLFYVRRPFRPQVTLPLFDTAQSQFNFASIFSDNSFVGQDRLSDENQLTAGVVTRFLDPQTGDENLRLGVVQRVRFSSQRVRLRAEDEPLTEELSDILFGASGGWSQRLRFGSTVQYSPDIDRVVRSTLSGRYSPGPYRTLALAYRLTRGRSEQVDIGWQWPLFGPRAHGGSMARTLHSPGGARAGRCEGNWYSVGRINYSMQESRVTDSLLGFEYESSCWIGRIVVERVSTSRVEATTRLLFQLEFSGLSRLGANPLRSLRDNIPGYRVIGEDRAPAPNRFSTYE